jgi:hypothetical protein
MVAVMLHFLIRKLGGTASKRGEVGVGTWETGSKGGDRAWNGMNGRMQEAVGRLEMSD